MKRVDRGIYALGGLYFYSSKATNSIQDDQNVEYSRNIISMKPLRQEVLLPAHISLVQFLESSASFYDVLPVPKSTYSDKTFTAGSKATAWSSNDMSLLKYLAENFP